MRHKEKNNVITPFNGERKEGSMCQEVPINVHCLQVSPSRVVLAITVYATQLKNTEF